VTWPALFAAFLACHLTGDLLLQTNWQATTKQRGFSDAAGRRALLSHVGIYTLAFVPALIWVGVARSPAAAVGIAALIAVSHLVVDDGRLLSVWMRRVKHTTNPAPSLSLMVDQSFHIIFLLAAAAIAAS
jgi:predicted protein tyrosine phosphatase